MKKKEKVTFWPNQASSAFFSLPLSRPALPGAAHSVAAPRGPVCRPTSAASSHAAQLATHVARPLPFSLAALRPHRSAPFLLSFLLPRASFFLPGSFLSPAAVSAARMEGHRRHPHMAGDQSRPLSFLFSAHSRPIKPQPSASLLPLDDRRSKLTTAAGELPLPEHYPRRRSHPKHRRTPPRP